MQAPRNWRVAQALGGVSTALSFPFCAYWVIKESNLGYAWIGTKVVLQDWKKRLDGGEVVRCCVYHRFLSNAHWERVCLCKINLIKRNIQIERHWDRSSWAPQMHTRTGLDFNVSLVFVYDDSHYSRANIASSKAIGLFLISEVIKATSIIWHMHA